MAVVDEEACYRALRGRETRFDGMFVVGVRTTGIYCRPSCPAITPKRANVRFFRTAAAAQLAGLRACKRCRPDATPGSPEWNLRADLAGRAMRLVADGVVDREGVRGLAARLGYSQRQVHRVLLAELGAGPLALARAQRAQTARTLLETTHLPVAHVAYAAGFASVRQFNDTVRVVFAATPTELRRRAAATAPGAGAITLRLPYRPPLDTRQVLGYLSGRAMHGVEAGDATSYRRTLSLPQGGGLLELSDPGEPGWLRCRLELDDLRDLQAAVWRARRLLDLDADPAAICETFGGDPVMGPLVASAPGLRSPGSVDPVETAVRVVLGQQVSVAGASTIAARLAARYGEPLAEPRDGLCRRFPSAAALAEADPADLPMPAGRRRALLTLCGALAHGELVLDPGADRDEASAALAALPGVGPWTVAAVRMRALGDPDVFLPTDLGVRRALERLGLPAGPRQAEELSRAWRPWRSYALAHLWATGGTAAT